MKFLLSESRLTSAIKSYLDSIPELKNLTLVEDNFFDWDQGTSVEVIFFESEPNNPQMEYYPIQSQTEGWDILDLESFPLLQLNVKTNLDKIMGDESEKYVKIWFEDKYNLPVKTVVF